MNIALRPQPERTRATHRLTEARIGGHATPLLTVEGVSLGFGGAVALDRVDLSVAPREIHAVIGPNGAGKSSLLNVVSGLYIPDAGRVRVGGEIFTRVPTRRLARLGVGRTFQNLALFGGLTVRDTILTGLIPTQVSGLAAQILGLPAARREARAQRDRADAVMADLALDPIADRLAGTLPYGLQKRVELARALVARPRLLLLDEPMAGMTATEKAGMSGFIRSARDATGTTIVLIEHDIGVVMSLSDRVTVLDHGRRIACGTPAEVQGDAAVIAAYLGLALDERDAA